MECLLYSFPHVTTRHAAHRHSNPHYVLADLTTANISSTHRRISCGWKDSSTNLSIARLASACRLTSSLACTLRYLTPLIPGLSAGRNDCSARLYTCRLLSLRRCMAHHCSAILRPGLCAGRNDFSSRFGSISFNAMQHRSSGLNSTPDLLRMERLLVSSRHVSYRHRASHHHRHQFVASSFNSSRHSTRCGENK